MEKYRPGPRRAAVLKLARKGVKAREIAEKLDMSRAMVYKHIDELRRRGMLPPAKRRKA